jgi:hypothetical protein
VSAAVKERPPRGGLLEESPCLGRINRFSSSRAASGTTLVVLVVESGDLVSGGKIFPKAGNFFPGQRDGGGAAGQNRPIGRLAGETRALLGPASIGSQKWNECELGALDQ